MKHFNPFAGRAETAQPVIPDSTKPKRARAKAKAKVEPIAEPQGVAAGGGAGKGEPANAAAPVAKPVALDNASERLIEALVQAAERVPLATYAALLVSTNIFTTSAKPAFVAFCQRGAPLRDWRMAWKAFEKAGFPGASLVGGNPITPPQPSNIIPFVQPAASLDAVLASIR
jgi:hypothetical protein